MLPMPKYSFHKTNEYRGHTGAIYSIAPSDKAGHFLSCGSEGIVAEWNTATAEGKAVAKAPGPIFSMQLIPERKLLLMGLENGDLIFNDLASKTPLRRIQLHKKAIFDFLPLPDGKHFLASGADGAISVWNLDALDHLHYQQVSPASIRSLVLSPGQELVAAGGSDGHIRLLDLGLILRHHWKAHELSVFRLAYSPDGRKLLSTGRDAHLTSWDATADYKKLQSVPAHTYAVNDIVFPGPGDLCLTGSMDKSIKLWRAEDLKLLKVCNFEKNQCHWNGVNRLLWQAGKLFSCSDDRKIMEWEISGLH